MPFPQVPGRRASVDIDAQRYLQIYNKLATALSLRGVVGSDTGALLSLCLPGQDIRPGLDPKDRTTQYYVSNALNRTLLCSWTVVPGAATISDVYKAVLDGKQTPLIRLSPDERKALDAAEMLLFHLDGGPTETYRLYQQYQLAYLAALDAYEGAEATHANGGAEVPHRLVVARDAAERDWMEKGHKSEVDNAIATIAELESREPATYWRKLAQLYRRYTLTLDPETGGEFQLVQSNPPYEQWFEREGWSDFTFDDRDFANQQGTGGGGLVALSCCCCSHGQEKGTGGTRGDRTALLAARTRPEDPEEPMPFLAGRMSLTGKIRRVEIMRPWLDVNLFHSRAWRWFSGSVSHGVVISSGGDIAGKVVPTGVMPVLPVTAILAADVVIEWEDDGQAAADIRARLSSGCMVRFGPFRLTAPPGEDGRIVIKGPQLIGFISRLLPTCPDPDPLLPWPAAQDREQLWPF